MNIEQIRQEREKAESNIMSVIKEFREKTGLSIVGVKIDSDIHEPLGYPKQREIVVFGVRLEIEPL